MKPKGKTLEQLISRAKRVGVWRIQIEFLRPPHGASVFLDTEGGAQAEEDGRTARRAFACALAALEKELRAGED